MRVVDEDMQNSILSYPGHDAVFLDFKELKQAVNTLSFREAWACVLVNKTDGKVYVGSACGENGLLQRIEAYTKGTHGNKILNEVRLEDLQLSIIYAIDKAPKKRF